jgi:hypothetical protein
MSRIVIVTLRHKLTDLKKMMCTAQVISTYSKRTTYGTSIHDQKIGFKTGTFVIDIKTYTKTYNITLPKK